MRQQQQVKTTLWAPTLMPPQPSCSSNSGLDLSPAKNVFRARTSPRGGGGEEQGEEETPPRRTPTLTREATTTAVATPSGSHPPGQTTRKVLVLPPTSIAQKIRSPGVCLWRYRSRDRERTWRMCRRRNYTGNRSSSSGGSGVWGSSSGGSSKVPAPREG